MASTTNHAHWPNHRQTAMPGGCFDRARALELHLRLPEPQTAARLPRQTQPSGGCSPALNPTPQAATPRPQTGAATNTLRAAVDAPAGSSPGLRGHRLVGASNRTASGSRAYVAAIHHSTIGSPSASPELHRGPEKYNMRVARAPVSPVTPLSLV